ncbi:hypothetical protein M3Y99_00235100 [Aphelenchoides fujianensis]|nr:hypothetical protein M3Y99_00235100 [Aphelenchoides fujianensis]
MGKKSGTESKHPTSRKSVRSPAKSGTPAVEGDRLADFVATVTRTSGPTARATQFEAVAAPGRLQCAAFLAEQRARPPHRLPAIVLDRKRVKLPPAAADAPPVFLNATYADWNREDYVLAQAPAPDELEHFWRLVWQDGCRLIVCVLERAGFSPTDPHGAAAFFPTDEQPLQLPSGRFVVRLANRADCKGGAQLYECDLTATDEADLKRAPDSQSGSSDAAADPRTRRVQVLHLDGWRRGEWPDVDQLAAFALAVCRAEAAIVKRITDDYVPPVVLVSLDALQRAPALWVWLILGKQIERREIFDVGALVHHVAKWRPGALTDRLAFFLTHAVALRMAAMNGWLTLEEAQTRIKEIRAGAK